MDLLEKILALWESTKNILVDYNEIICVIEALLSILNISIAFFCSKKKKEVETLVARIENMQVSQNNAQTNNGNMAQTINNITKEKNGISKKKVKKMIKGKLKNVSNVFTGHKAPENPQNNDIWIGGPDK